MKKILIIDEYEPMREYLSQRLSASGFEVITARNGLDGMIKMRKTDPHLIIMDYFLTRKSIKEILKEKADNPNISAIPIIILSSHLGEQNTALLRKYNIISILTKPLKIDLLFKAISNILNIRLNLDTTPCILEAHFNTDILFIEIARGLNRDKIDLLRFKIIELTELYKVKEPKILIIMTDISADTITQEKLFYFLEIIISQTATPLSMLNILTSAEIVSQLLHNSKIYNNIKITNHLEKALNSLMGIKLTEFLEEGKDIIKKDFITNSEDSHLGEENINLKFARETTVMDYSSLAKDMILAVVDDDEYIHSLIKTAFAGSGWQIKSYTNGKLFIDDLQTTAFNLIYLDLMMPEMNGFKVLAYLKEKNIQLPIIILSALSHIETVEKAISFGIKSYMSKPLHLDLIIKKTKELLKKNF